MTLFHYINNDVWTKQTYKKGKNFKNKIWFIHLWNKIHMSDALNNISILLILVHLFLSPRLSLSQTWERPMITLTNTPSLWLITRPWFKTLGLVRGSGCTSFICWLHTFCNPRRHMRIRIMRKDFAFRFAFRARLLDLRGPLFAGSPRKTNGFLSLEHFQGGLINNG